MKTMNSSLRGQMKTVIVIMVASWCLITVFYYNLHSLMKTYKSVEHPVPVTKPNSEQEPITRIVQIDQEKETKQLPVTKILPTTVMDRDFFYNGTEDFLINTAGCYIPNYSKTLVYNPAHYLNKTCGDRAIFVSKISNENIEFVIDKKIEKYVKGKRKYECCYKFVSATSNHNGTKQPTLIYTSCQTFKNGTKTELKEEIITVSCKDSSKKLIYEDAYTLVKKIEQDNVNQKNNKSWNVILLGMDTMSRARIFSTMPKTVKYFKENDWLDYKGYQKVGLNTFPNLMAFLTGKKISSIYKACSHGMVSCNDLIIWSNFSDAGYVTAYGEDFLRLPDTFARYGYERPPTHHYLRPFLMTGEENKGNLVCAKKMTSGKHILNYASDFVETYKNDTFFGMFWLNSYSHNKDNIPALFDKDVTEFLDKLKKSDALDNTFVIFLSDHGIRFGDMRVPMESYYEERLPMLFIWTPTQFRQSNADMYNSLQINQNRLVSNYDVYLTMASILKINNRSVELQSEACPKCTSLFEEQSVFKTCTDAGVDDKWCSCHNMTAVDKSDVDAGHSLELALSYVQSKAISVDTKPCTTCSALKLKTLLRSHWYENGKDNNTYYVFAFTVTPGDVGFEATVLKAGNNYTIIQPTDTISPYNTRGSCVINPNIRSYCVCKNVKCNKKPKR